MQTKRTVEKWISSKGKRFEIRTPTLEHVNVVPRRQSVEGERKMFHVAKRSPSRRSWVLGCLFCRCERLAYPSQVIGCDDEPIEPIWR